MSALYAIDLPSSAVDPDAEWVAYDYYGTREAAIADAQRLFGADDQGRVSLVSKLPDEDEPEEILS